MGPWNDGAGERTARAHHDGVQANEAARQQNRLESQDKDLAHREAMSDYHHAQARLRSWESDNRAWQLKEYDKECRAADKEGRESLYRTPDDVPDRAGRPDVPFKPVVREPKVREPVKVPMGMGTFAIIVAAILIGWSFVGDFVANAYVIGVFAVPAAWVVWILIFFKKKNDAAGNQDRLDSLERWNPLTIAARITFWFLGVCWKLFKIGIR